jgi:DNA polymerase III subunit gamma/tau
MAYQVLARKWRPRTFSEMVGQTHVLRALMNALSTDRLHHAYLFTGTRGVGKTTIARIFAKSLNCETHGVSDHPCGHCRTCTEIDGGRFVDLIEVDAASRTGVDDTRELLDNVQYAPTRGRYKVYLIDEVHMLTRQSFNALLKTLEEPPPHIKFLLATTDPQKLLPTVLSRCLQFNLKRLPLELIHSHLSHILETEQIAFEPASLHFLARAADGSMRDALSLLDQAIAYGAGQLTVADVSAMLGTLEQGVVYHLLRSLMANDAVALLNNVKQLAESNPDFNQVLADLLSILQKIALAQVLPDSLNNELPEDQMIAELAPQISPEDVQLFYQIGLTGRRDLPYAPEQRGGFEMLLLRMLAFRPVNATFNATDTAKPMPNRTMADAPRPVAATTVTHVPPTAAAVPEKKTIVKTPPVSSPVSPAPITPTNTPNNTPAHSPAKNQALTLNNPEDWLHLVKQLPLGGAVRQLALNCALTQVSGHTLHLQLAEKSAILKGRVLELEKAILNYCGEAYHIEFHITQQLDTTTVAELQHREQNEYEQQLKVQIQNDPFVQSLQQRFGAKIMRIQANKNGENS